MRKSKEDALVGLSESHQSEEYEYELWGAVAGAPGGRWSVTQVNPEAVWPTGVALYVRRVKK
mgnify:CR=1 FL=1